MRASSLTASDMPPTEVLKTDDWTGLPDCTSLSACSNVVTNAVSFSVSAAAALLFGWVWYCLSNSSSVCTALAVPCPAVARSASVAADPDIAA